MSAQVTEAHLELARTIRTMFANPYRPSSDAAQLIADSEAKACDQLRADVEQWELAFQEQYARAESAEREAEEQCLLNGKGAEREASLLGQLERSAREIEQKRNLLTVAIKSAGDQATRAELAEAEVADLKANNRFHRGHSAGYAEAKADCESELAGIRALAGRRNKSDHSADTTHQLVAALDQALDIAQAQLAAERAKVRTLRSACESICEEWGKSHDAPFYAGSEMEKLASKALEKTEDAP